MTFNDRMTDMIQRYKKRNNLRTADVADRLNISVNTLSNKMCSNNEHEFKASEIEAIVKLTNDKAASRALDSLLSPSQAGFDQIKDQLIDVNIATGQLNYEVSTAAEDGKINENEAKRIESQFAVVDEAKKKLRGTVTNAVRQGRMA